MNFDKKKIQYRANYRSKNYAYKTSNIVPGIDAGIVPGIMPEISKGTVLGIALGLYLGIVFKKHLT